MRLDVPHGERAPAGIGLAGCSLPAMPPLRDAPLWRDAWAGTDWADRRGWLSMNVRYFRTVGDQLSRPVKMITGKMSCFSVASHERPFRARQQTLFRIHEQQNFSNFTESQKELKTVFEIPFPFFTFPRLPFRQEGGSRPDPSSR